MNTQPTSGDPLGLGTRTEIVPVPLPPHKQRVIDEKAELDERLAKLIVFIESPKTMFHGLHGEEANRLRRQAVVMREYSSILADRIAAFGVQR